MKVLLVSTYEQIGGAATACQRLHRALSAQGVASELLVRHRQSEDRGVTVFRTSEKSLARLGRRWRRRLAESQISGARKPDYFSGDLADYAPEIFHQRRPDLVHLHWIHRFLDLGLVLRTAADRRIPIVWTLHDFRPLTGGCHFPGACNRFMVRCGKCPELSSTKELDPTRRSWERIHQAVAACRPYLVAPSRWLASQIQKTPDFGGCPVRVIPYGLDTETFRPRDKGACREVLGLPPNRTIVLYIADRPDDPRKGGDLLMEALMAIPKETRPLLLTCGRRAPEVPSGIESFHAGHETSARWLSVIYGASDLVALPSREDNFPQTGLEAMACGRALVGFRIGGIPDMIEEGEQGFLAEPGNAQSLRQALERVLQQPEMMWRLGVAARAKAEANYSLAASARAHLTLYREMLGR